MPKQSDMNNFYHVLAYLKNTKDLGMIFTGTVFNPAVYIDASFNIHNDAKSQTGFVCRLNLDSAPILCKSYKQKTVATSSCMAELIALHEGTNHALWFNRLLNFLGYVNSSMKVYQDNQATMSLANGGPARGKSKWINVKYFAVKEHIDNNTISLEYIPSNDNIADILTKAIHGSKFIELRNKLLGYHNIDISKIFPVTGSVR